MIRLICYILLIIFISKSIFAQSDSLHTPKYEVRAVWLTTVAGLDWPQTYDSIQQKQSLMEIIEKLKIANFNTIFFQIRSRGDAMYNSSYEPWSQQLTGRLGENPGWDPLSFIIEETHKRGMELHAWFNTFLVRSTGGKPSESFPRHIILSHPDWVRFVDNDWWLDPGIPAVREYIIKVAMEVVRNYEIDGFQFDYMRYPGSRFPDEETYSNYGNQQQRKDWRRENINSLISAFYDSAIAVKPMLKVGSAPIGVYTNINGINGWQSYHELYQDSRRWLSEGKQDYLAPQIYWSLGTQKGDPDFSLLAKEWSENSFNRHIYLGIGAFKSEISKQLPLYIDVSREVGVEGMAFFRFSSIDTLLQLERRYDYPALIPPMKWKDSIPPERLINLTVKNIIDGIYKLQWEKPQTASDGDDSKYINIYRSTNKTESVNEPQYLLKTISAKRLEYFDTIIHPTAARYYYAITSVDKGNNESQPTTEESVIITEIDELSKQLVFRSKLCINFTEPVADVLMIPYEVKQSAGVILKILDGENNEIITVVDTIQHSGRYIAAAEISKLDDGMYSCLFITGDYLEKKSFIIDN